MKFVLESRKRRKNHFFFPLVSNCSGTQQQFSRSIYFFLLSLTMWCLCVDIKQYFSQFHLSFFSSKKKILLLLLCWLSRHIHFPYFDIKSVRRSSISCQSMLPWLYISILTVIWSRERAKCGFKFLIADLLSFSEIFLLFSS